MRTAFIKTLTKEAGKNPNIFLLTADLGFMLFEDFAKKFPKRFLNMGVSEANMIGAASGLALCGKIVVVYSIANFTTLRVLEQIRNDLCYQNANVKIVGVGSGFVYGYDGFTHYNLEDIAAIRSLPNITIVSPADPIEVELATKKILYRQGPIYLRLGKTGEPKIHKKKPRFSIGKGITIREGKKAVILATGSIVHQAIIASSLLEKKRIKVGVIDIHTIKPLDSQLIIKTAQTTTHLFTLEEHSIVGGLGSAVAEVLSEAKIKNLQFKRLGVPDKTHHFIGSREYLCQHFSLSPEKIVKTILKSL